MKIIRFRYIDIAIVSDAIFMKIEHKSINFEGPFCMCPESSVASGAGTGFGVSTGFAHDECLRESARQGQDPRTNKGGERTVGLKCFGEVKCTDGLPRSPLLLPAHLRPPSLRTVALTATKAPSPKGSSIVSLKCAGGAK